MGCEDDDVVQCLRDELLDLAVGRRRDASARPHDDLECCAVNALA
jgi:hypothetical protein